MKKIIITGFLPFGDYFFNPTEDLVHYFNRKVVGGYEIIGVILPCTYYGAFNTLEKIYR